jgi:uncharacterized protein (DUF2252 family)
VKDLVNTRIQIMLEAGASMEHLKQVQHHYREMSESDFAIEVKEQTKKTEENRQKEIKEAEEKAKQQAQEEAKQVADEKEAKRLADEEAAKEAKRLQQLKEEAEKKELELKKEFQEFLSKYEYDEKTDVIENHPDGTATLLRKIATYKPKVVN